MGNKQPPGIRYCKHCSANLNTYLDESRVRRCSICDTESTARPKASDGWKRFSYQPPHGNLEIERARVQEMKDKQARGALRRRAGR